MLPMLIMNPSTDDGFVSQAAAALTEGEGPELLEELLRLQYPQAAVRQVSSRMRAWISGTCTATVIRSTRSFQPDRAIRPVEGTGRCGVSPLASLRDGIDERDHGRSSGDEAQKECEDLRKAAKGLERALTRAQAMGSRRSLGKPFRLGCMVSVGGSGLDGLCGVDGLVGVSRGPLGRGRLVLGAGALESDLARHSSRVRVGPHCRVNATRRAPLGCAGGRSAEYCLSCELP